MPSTSKKQAHFMAAIAHNPEFAKKVGVKQSVGKDFNAADKGKKFGIGGSTTYTEGGEKQVNKQGTRWGSTLGSQKGVPNINLNKYIGKKEGGTVATKKMSSDMKEDMKMDKSQDKAMIKKAFKQHDSQEHVGGKGTKLALKKGGETKSMAKGGSAKMKETMGPRTMSKDVEAGSNKLSKFGQSAVQKRGMTRGMNLGDSGPTVGIEGGMKKGGGVKKMATGGSTSSRADGIASRGKTKTKYC